MDNIPQAMQDNIGHMSDNGYQIIDTYLSPENPYNENKRQCIVYYIDALGNVATSQYIDGANDVQTQYISLHRIRQLYKIASKKAEACRSWE